WDVGKQPFMKQALAMPAGVGAKMSICCLISHVGAGSSSQCLFCAALISLLISSDVTCSNLSKNSTDLGRIVGAGAPTVEARIVSTLSTKNCANCSAENGPQATGGG